MLRVKNVEGRFITFKNTGHATNVVHVCVILVLAAAISMFVPYVIVALRWKNEQ